MNSNIEDILACISTWLEMINMLEEDAEEILEELMDPSYCFVGEDSARRREDQQKKLAGVREKQEEARREIERLNQQLIEEKKKPPPVVQPTPSLAGNNNNELPNVSAEPYPEYKMPYEEDRDYRPFSFSPSKFGFSSSNHRFSFLNRIF